MSNGKATENQGLLTEKLFLGTSTFLASRDATLMISDPAAGPAIAIAVTPNPEDGAMFFGEIERRWNVHRELVAALRALHDEVKRDSDYSSTSREMFGPLLERADRVLKRIAAEEAAAGIALQGQAA